MIITFTEVMWPVKCNGDRKSTDTSSVHLENLCYKTTNI